MLLRVLSGLVVVAAIAAIAGPAAAEGYRAHKSRQHVSEAPVKDCTRLNGRIGYYGNPWCTPAEQARWDAWSTQRR